VPEDQLRLRQRRPECECRPLRLRRDLQLPAGVWLQWLRLQQGQVSPAR
jgi:hypothetical protein